MCRVGAGNAPKVGDGSRDDGAGSFRCPQSGDCRGAPRNGPERHEEVDPGQPVPVYQGWTRVLPASRTPKAPRGADLASPTPWRPSVRDSRQRSAASRRNSTGPGFSALSSPLSKVLSPRWSTALVHSTQCKAWSSETERALES